jgi:hypothetical protein
MARAMEHSLLKERERFTLYLAVHSPQAVSNHLWHTANACN